MKTKYKHIYFERVTEDGWLCNNNKTDALLGKIEYYKPWKRYIFEAEEVAIFDSSCLRDIAEFLDNLTQERKGK